MPTHIRMHIYAFHSIPCVLCSLSCSFPISLLHCPAWAAIYPVSVNIFAFFFFFFCIDKTGGGIGVWISRYICGKMVWKGFAQHRCHFVGLIFDERLSLMRAHLSSCGEPMYVCVCVCKEHGPLFFPPLSCNEWWWRETAHVDLSWV